MISGLIDLLRNASTVSSIAGGRVHANKAPQNSALPYIIVTQISSEENQTLDGSVGVRAVDFDIDCKAERSVTANNLGNAVRIYIQNYTGTAGTETIKAVNLNDQSSQYESPEDGSDRGVYVSIIDATIHYEPI